MKKSIELFILWTIYRFFRACGTDGMRFGFDKDKCDIHEKVKKENSLANQAIEACVKGFHSSKQITSLGLVWLLSARKCANETRLRMDTEHVPFVRKCIYHYWLVTSMLTVHRFFNNGFISIPLDNINCPDASDDRDKEVMLYNNIVIRLLEQPKEVINHEK